MACEKLPTRYGIWKEWQRDYRFPWLYKMLVLIGLKRSPTFEYFGERGLEEEE